MYSIMSFFSIVSIEHCVFLIMLYMLKPKQGPELKCISSYKLSVRNISCILWIGAVMSVKKNINSNEKWVKFTEI